MNVTELKDKEVTVIHTDTLHDTIKTTKDLDETYIFKLKIGDKTYTLDIKWLLNLKMELTNNLSDLELEDSLQKIAGYLHTFSSAYETANSLRMKEELEYEIWYEKLYKEIEAEISQKYNNEVNAGLRSKTNATATKNAIHSEIVSRYEKEYREKTTKLNETKSNADFLFRELKLIESRGTHLQTLIKARQSIKTIEG